MSSRFKRATTISIVIAIVFGVLSSIIVSTTHLEKTDDRFRTCTEKFESVLDVFNAIGNYPIGDEEKIIDTAVNQMMYGDGGAFSRIQIAKILEPDKADSELKIIYDDNLITFDSAILADLDENHLVTDEIKDETGYAFYIAGLSYGRESVYLVRMRFDMDDIYNDREELLISLISAYLLLELIVLVIVNIYMKNDAKRVTALEEACEKLEREAERQEAFMGAFAHELKTPMTSIIGYADLLRQSNLDDESRLEASNFIFNEGRRLEKLSFKLLDLLLLNKDKLEFKEVSLKSVVDGACESIKPVLDKRNVKLVEKVGKTKGYMEPELIKTLLYNLIDNGSKAIENQGIIVVKGESVPGGCKISVVDNGIGLEKEEFNKITEAFYRVDKSRSRKQGGVGLGLSICSRIVDIHGGEIKFDSILGKGTCVEVILYNKNARKIKEDEGDENA